MMSVVTFLHDETGATAIEYGLVAAFISLAGIVALQAMGTNISSFFSSVSSTIDAVQPGA